MGFLCQLLYLIYIAQIHIFLMGSMVAEKIQKKEANLHEMLPVQQQDMD
jgi:hypothetical protein